MARKPKILAPIHPGEFLFEHMASGFSTPEKPLTPYRIAIDLGLRPPVIYELIKGKRSITAPLALRLGRYFGTSAQMWLNLQATYDLTLAELELGEHVRDSVKPIAA